MKYTAVYECRMCGKLFDRGDKRWRAWATMELFNPTPAHSINQDLKGAEPYPVTIMHVCCDKSTVGMAGVADFVGIRRESDQYRYPQTDIQTERK